MAILAVLAAAAIAFLVTHIPSGKPPRDAPRTVPAALRPAHSRPSGPQTLYIEYRATGTSDEGFGYTSKLVDWFEQRLGRGATLSGPGTVAFRRFHGRYSGSVAVSPTLVRRPSGAPTAIVTVTIVAPLGRTRLPRGFPLIDPDLDSGRAPVLHQVYVQAPSEARATVAHYRRALGKAVTDRQTEGGGDVLLFDDFKGLHGRVSVIPGRVTVDLSKAGAMDDDYSF